MPSSTNHTVASLLGSDASAPVSPDVVVSGVSMDSRLVRAGDVYLAVAGAISHGIAFADAAIAAGAVAVVVDHTDIKTFSSDIERLQQAGVVVASVNALKKKLGFIAARFYDNPSHSLKVVAVTGTDGKTSVCQFVAQAVNAVGGKCGYIGTIGWGYRNLNKTELTTPDAVSIQKMLAQMRDEGAKVVALEASSHGLEEGRLDALSIDIAVLTNLGRDHLDYHKDLQSYKKAKARLFEWQSLHTIVVNGTDDLGRELATATSNKCIVFVPQYLSSGNSVDARTGESLVAGKDQCFAQNDQFVDAASAANATMASRLRNSRGQTPDLLSTESILHSAAGMQFELLSNEQRFTQHTTLLGEFNIDNLLATFGVLKALGQAANDASVAIDQVLPVPGRMERFNSDDYATAVVDYSHTPQALEAAIAVLRKHCEGALWVVFGCGGDRDPGKRAPMGRAAELADHIVVTDDNPRTEKPAEIHEQIVSGMATPSTARVIANRADAITYAMDTAAANDLVLIAGKGHEDYQIIGTKKQAFSDRDVIQRLTAGRAS